MRDTAVQAKAHPKRLDSSVSALELTSEGVRLLDQTRLPLATDWVTITTPEAMVEAIRVMVVRGAPAIGIAGAYGVVLSARRAKAQNLSWPEAVVRIRTDALALREARPTAVNLAWAIDRLLPVLEQAGTTGDIDALIETLSAEARRIHEDDRDACMKMGDYGVTLVTRPGAGILTHCNAGALATGGYGTALGVVRSAFAQDATLRVYADETRPRLQGARLTTWELLEDGIPVTLVCEGMAATLMREGHIDLVVVGADRIAANGDAANKIGTYALALAAHAHDIPFYIAAPLSTIDLAVPNGGAIPIEHRADDEVTRMGAEQLAPAGVSVYNPAFDVTPARYIAGIITEQGIARPDYAASLPRLFESAARV